MERHDDNARRLGAGEGSNEDAVGDRNDGSVDAGTKGDCENSGERGCRRRAKGANTAPEIAKERAHAVLPGCGARKQQH
jgi:hypothetical protein